jgi:hypothetical protein
MPMVQVDNMNQISLHREDFKAITEFIEKYPESDYVTISVDSSSGIGSVVKVSINNVINGDAVTIIKTVVDESGW